MRDGWKVRTAEFDFGRFWGVAVSSEQPIDGRIRRFAVRATPGLTEEQAIAECVPALSEWIDSEGWDTRKP